MFTCNKKIKFINWFECVCVFWFLLVYNVKRKQYITWWPPHNMYLFSFWCVYVMFSWRKGKKSSFNMTLDGVWKSEQSHSHAWLFFSFGRVNLHLIESSWAVFWLFFSVECCFCFATVKQSLFSFTSYWYHAVFLHSM